MSESLTVDAVWTSAPRPGSGIGCDIGVASVDPAEAARAAAASRPAAMWRVFMSLVLLLRCGGLSANTPTIRAERPIAHPENYHNSRAASVGLQGSLTSVAEWVPVRDNEMHARRLKNRVPLPCLRIGPHAVELTIGDIAANNDGPS